MLILKTLEHSVMHGYALRIKNIQQILMIFAG